MAKPSKLLFYNARVHTQASDYVADSLAVSRNRIVAVGKRLERDPEFNNYSHIDLKGHCVTPGLVDAHTHFHFFALSFRRVSLHDIDSLDECLRRIEKFAKTLGPREWITGEGYAPDRFRKKIEPDRYMLDKVSGGRPACLFSKDQHSSWANSKALQLAGITKMSKDPNGGKIERDANGEPTGILREGPAQSLVYDLIPDPNKKTIDQCHKLAFDYAWKKGVTGVHSVDSPLAFDYYLDMAARKKLHFRIHYYMGAGAIDTLFERHLKLGYGDDFFQLRGVKLFSDGSLGSQTALCFNKYLGSKNNYGIEALSTSQMAKIIKKAARLGLPCAIHAIGDKAVCNVIDAIEQSPALPIGARHRIEHLQQIRRKDIPRLKRLGIVASMQPSHCPSDIDIVRKYWGKQGANAYIFRTLIDKGIPLAFGSDCPIEPLDPLAGIAAAVRRARKGKRDVFYPEQRITAAEALYNFTAGPAYAVGAEQQLGYLLPGYLADFVILEDDPTRVAPSNIYDIPVLATFVDGRPKHLDRSIRL